MTQWVAEPEGGRARGPLGVGRAWVEVLLRPRRFFQNGVAPGDQAPGLVFAVGVTLVFVGTRFAFDPDAIPVLGGRPLLSAVLATTAVGLLIAPLVLHLVAAIQTLILIPLVPDRAGVSETVQVIAYATAPCVFAGIPIPWVRVACVLYGAGLLTMGTGVVHRTSLPRAVAVSALPAVVVFGYAFGGLGAIESVTGVDLVNSSVAPTGE